MLSLSTRPYRAALQASWRDSAIKATIKRGAKAEKRHRKLAQHLEENHLLAYQTANEAMWRNQSGVNCTENETSL